MGAHNSDIHLLWRPLLAALDSCYTLILLERCGTVWYGVVWCGEEGHGVAWHGVAGRGRARRSVVWCGVAWYGMVWHGVVWCGVAWCGAAWLGMVCCSVVRYGLVCRMRCYQMAMAGMSCTQGNAKREGCVFGAHPLVPATLPCRSGCGSLEVGGHVRLP